MGDCLNLRLKKFLKSQHGGITFVEVVIAVVLIMIAAVAVTLSMSYGHAFLEREYRRKAALAILKQEMEYWQGRLNTTEVSRRELQGSQRGQEVVIDERGPGSQDDVKGKLYYGRIEQVDSPLNGPADPDEFDYYSLRIWIEWHELGAERDQMERITLTTRVIPYEAPQEGD
ncbi:hypothetical protein ISS37_00910 [candidate division KSB1 bacterium]|nr:hypothetical protein [candidate division KSB1 bacterium]